MAAKKPTSTIPAAKLAFYEEVQDEGRTAELKKYVAISRAFAEQLGTKRTSTRARSLLARNRSTTR